MGVTNHLLNGMILQVGHPETEGYVACSKRRHMVVGERLHDSFFSRQKFPHFYEFINLPGKQPLLLISINFTPKTTHRCLRKWYVPLFSRYFFLVRVSTTQKMAWKLGSGPVNDGPVGLGTDQNFGWWITLGLRSMNFHTSDGSEIPRNSWSWYVSHDFFRVLEWTTLKKRFLTVSHFFFQQYMSWWLSLGFIVQSISYF